jgi:hypothetical protein
MISKCINLQEQFGGQYRLGLDEAAKDKTDPSMMTIPGRWGIIYPYGGEMLAVEIDCHSKKANQVAAIPGVLVHQDGDDEKTFVFPVTIFAEVAAIVEPKRSKRLTDEQKAKLIDAGKPHQFQSGANEGFLERQEPPTPKGDQGVV